ncbi:MAG: hypothetical protein WC102_08250 [Saccharofermentanales bacterium]
MSDKITGWIISIAKVREIYRRAGNAGGVFVRYSYVKRLTEIITNDPNIFETISKPIIEELRTDYFKQFECDVPLNECVVGFAVSVIDIEGKVTTYFNKDDTIDVMLDTLSFAHYEIYGNGSNAYKRYIN